MRFDIVTIFPDFFGEVFRFGILGRALGRGGESSLASVHIHDLRAFTHDRHRTVDDRPFGGGEGMVLKPGPIFAALEALAVAPKTARDPGAETVILLSAQGRPFTQTVAHELAATRRIVFICGRYEGVDERVNERLCDRELSIGDYVLSGGELAAAVVIDAVVRLLPGALGNADSAHFESFGPGARPAAAPVPAEPPPSTNAAGGLLDYPHYTRPAEFDGAAVPEVLLGGSHEAVRRWRREMALAKTLHNRPDLLDRAALTAEDRRLLDKLRRASG